MGMEQVEIYLVYAGQAAIVASTVWLIVTGRVAVGALLLVGFFLMGQYGYCLLYTSDAADE